MTCDPSKWSGHDKMYISMNADSKGPDQTAHPRSLIWVFAGRLRTYLKLLSASKYSKCFDETARTRRLILILTSVVRILY